MKTAKKVLIGIASVAMIAGSLLAQETKYSASSTATSPAVTFGPRNGRTVITAVSASTDKQNGAVKFYSRDTKFALAAVPTNGETTILVTTNAGILCTNNNVVTYVHKNGTCDQTTVSSATATSITLAAGITVAGTATDYLYKLTQSGQMAVGSQANGPGTNTVLNVAGYTVFASPGDSPVYITVDSLTNSSLQATTAE